MNHSIISNPANNMKANLLKGVYTLLLVTSILLISAITSSAQYYPKIEFEKGDMDISAGIGLMPTFVDKNTKAALPPISMSMTYRFKKHLAIGTYFGYSATDYVNPVENILKSESQTSMRNNFYIIGLRGEGHFVRDRVDFYGGGMIGYSFSNNRNVQAGQTGSIENIKVETYADQLTWSGLIGLKYLISPKVGLYGEVCYGVSLFNVGATFKL